MIRNTRHFGAGLALAVLVSGCGVNRELQEQYIDLKNDTRYQITLVEKQGSFLEEKINQVGEKVDRLEASEGDFAKDISSFVARPGQVKREVLDEVDQRSAGLAVRQSDLFRDFQRRLSDYDASINQSLDAQTVVMRGTLADEDEFFRFVFAEQDSVNQVFAARFDSKPWYTSILARRGENH